VRATELARKMVCEYGMSEMGPLTYGKKEQEVFLGREIGQAQGYSDETAQQIDKAVRRLVDEGYASAYSILENNREVMHAMAAALLERETLDAAEIELLMQGKELGPVKSSLAYADGDGDTQKVLKPEGGRKAGFGEGHTTPA
jgi:cell division protease FtsH